MGAAALTKKLFDLEGVSIGALKAVLMVLTEGNNIVKSDGGVFEERTGRGNEGERKQRPKKSAGKRDLAAHVGWLNLNAQYCYVYGIFNVCLDHT